MGDTTRLWRFEHVSLGGDDLEASKWGSQGREKPLFFLLTTLPARLTAHIMCQRLGGFGHKLNKYISNYFMSSKNSWPWWSASLPQFLRSGFDDATFSLLMMLQSTIPYRYFIFWTEVRCEYDRSALTKKYKDFLAKNTCFILLILLTVWGFGQQPIWKCQQPLVIERVANWANWAGATLTNCDRLPLRPSPLPFPRQICSLQKHLDQLFNNQNSPRSCNLSWISTYCNCNHCDNGDTKWIITVVLLLRFAKVHSMQPTLPQPSWLQQTQWQQHKDRYEEKDNNDNNNANINNKDHNESLAEVANLISINCLVCQT